MVGPIDERAVQRCPESSISEDLEEVSHIDNK